MTGLCDKNAGELGVETRIKDEKCVRITWKASKRAAFSAPGNSDSMTDVQPENRHF